MIAALSTGNTKHRHTDTVQRHSTKSRKLSVWLWAVDFDIAAARREALRLIDRNEPREHATHAGTNPAVYGPKLRWRTRTAHLALQEALAGFVMLDSL